MLIAIEEGLISVLEHAALQVRDIDIDKLKAGLAHPAVFAAIDAGSFTKQGQSVFRCEAKITLVAVFRHLASERDRRHGLYPILEGLLGLLAGQTLGLAITALQPVRFRNVTFEAIRKLGLCAYELELKTSFDTRKAEDPDLVTDLLKIGLNYYLQDPADNGTSDAADLVTLGS